MIAKQLKSSVIILDRKPDVVSGRIAALAAWPIFGGEDPVEQPKPGDPANDQGNQGNGAGQTTTTPAGGLQDNDQISRLKDDPEALTTLLRQVQNLEADLKAVSSERDSFQEEKDQAARLQMSKEQQLQTDLDNANLQIERMQAVISQAAIKNAILEQGDYSWHSITQMMAELDPKNYDVDIDLDNGKAVVSGMESEVKRIADKCPWLVKSSAKTESSAGGRRTAGSPPRPPANQEQQKAKRDALISRFPVIAQGR